MIIEINLDKNNIKLILKNGRNIVDEIFWAGEYTLNEKLLFEIDKMLKKNKIKKLDIEKIVPKISKNSGVTSSRIVMTLTKSWTSAKTYAIIER